MWGRSTVENIVNQHFLHFLQYKLKKINLSFIGCNTLSEKEKDAFKSLFLQSHLKSHLCGNGSLFCNALSLDKFTILLSSTGSNLPHSMKENVDTTQTIYLLQLTYESNGLWEKTRKIL